MTGSFWRGILAAAGLLASSFSIAAQQEIKVYNWSDYINPAVLDAFTRETGINVIYDTFDQMEAVEAKLKTGRSGYDLAVVTVSFLPRHIPLKLYTPIDKAKVPNLSHMWPEITSRLSKADPGNRHAVNYVWGTTGIGFNVKKVQERLGPEAKVDSWSMLFDPEKLRKLATCGVHVLDATEDMFPLALRYLGLDPDSKKENDLRRAADLLMKIRPHVRKFHSSEYITALANGDICLAVGHSGDILQATKRANEARNGVEIGYAIPKEGALIWFDSFVIPSDATNRDGAHRFIDFLNRPEVAALNSGFIRYATPNLTAQNHLPADVLGNPAIYPPADVMGRLFTITPFDEKTQQSVNRLWARVKSGK